MSEELRPCPFCGDKPKVTYNKVKSFPVTWIDCKKEGHHKVVAVGRTEKEAIEVWNSPRAADAEIERLRLRSECNWRAAREFYRRWKNREGYWDKEGFCR